MKTTLYMTLSVDGYLGQAGERPIPKDILTNFMQCIGRAGNLIVGKRTYDLIYAQNAHTQFANIDLVVVSHTDLQTDGVHFAKSPQSALQYLKQKGFEEALIGGGAQINSAFLSESLVDELYLNIDSRIANKGIRLAMPQDFEANLRLMEHSLLGIEVVQLHYLVG